MSETIGKLLIENTGTVLAVFYLIGILIFIAPKLLTDYLNRRK